MGNTTVLMSSPDYFKVEYSINPWMIEGVDVNLDLAKQQWENLKSTIENAGASVKVVPPNEKYPDLVFTANSGIVKEDRVLIANFKYQRKTRRRGDLRKLVLRKWIRRCQEFHQSSNLREEEMPLFWETTL